MSSYNECLTKYQNLFKWTTENSSRCSRKSSSSTFKTWVVDLIPKDIIKNSKVLSPFLLCTYRCSFLWGKCWKRIHSLVSQPQDKFWKEFFSHHIEWVHKQCNKILILNYNFIPLVVHSHKLSSWFLRIGSTLQIVP